jgi:putative membrane protein
MNKIIARLLANMAGIYIASLVFPSIAVSSLQALFWCGLVLGLVNLLLRPLLLFISLPVNILTLGLFTLVINAAMVLLATYFISGVHIPSFLLAVATSVIISVLNIILTHIFGN